MEFNFDNQKQNIMDIHIPDQHCYYVVRDAMHYNVMEGWQPTTNDVNDLIHEYYHPDRQRDERNQQAIIKCLNQADIDGIAHHLKITDLKLDSQKTHNDDLTL